MRFVYYLLISAGIAGVFYSIGKISESVHPVTLTKSAQQPDYFLRNTKLYFQEGEKDRSKDQLAQGIKAVEKIQKEADPESNELISPALEDLRKLYTQLPNEVNDFRDINVPCIEVLLALTYQQIIVAEKLVMESGNMTQVKRALGYAMDHVRTALIMSEGDRKDSEVMIYAEMNDILSNPHLDKEEVLAKIKEIKDDTRDLEISFFH